MKINGIEDIRAVIKKTREGLESLARTADLGMTGPKNPETARIGRESKQSLRTIHHALNALEKEARYKNGRDQKYKSSVDNLRAEAEETIRDCYYLLEVQYPSIMK